MGKMNDRAFYGSLEEAFVALLFFFSFLKVIRFLSPFAKPGIASKTPIP
jgi:hypothetical protein